MSLPHWPERRVGTYVPTLLRLSTQTVPPHPSPNPVFPTISRADNVWYARDVETGDRVVIKLFDQELFPDVAGQRDAKTLAEVDVLKTLSKRYPGRVVAYKDFYANEEQQYVLVMELLECTLQDVLNERKKLPEAEAKDAIFGMLDAISCVHSEHFVHRDIKPGNLLLAHKCDLTSIKIADFGCTVGNIGYDNLNQVAGTLPYMAPEMLSKSMYGKAVDMWSAGVTAYQILVGALPFRASGKNPGSKQQLTAIKKSPIDYRSLPISESAKDFLRALLEMDPTKRMTVEQALDHRWLNFADDGPVPPVLPPRDAPPLPPRASLENADAANAMQQQVVAKASKESLGGGKKGVRFDEAPVIVDDGREDGAGVEEHGTMNPVPGCPGWLVVQQADGTSYYYNEETDETTWEPPVPSIAPAASADASLAKAVPVVVVPAEVGGLAGDVEGQEALGKKVDGFPDWRALTGDDGRLYYWNVVTEETRWDPPGIETNVDNKSVDDGWDTEAVVNGNAGNKVAASFPPRGDSLEDLQSSATATSPPSAAPRTATTSATENKPLWARMKPILTPKPASLSAPSADAGGRSPSPNRGHHLPWKSTMNQLSAAVDKMLHPSHARTPSNGGVPASHTRSSSDGGLSTSHIRVPSNGGLATSHARTPSTGALSTPNPSVIAPPQPLHPPTIQDRPSSYLRPRASTQPSRSPSPSGGRSPIRAATALPARPMSPADVRPPTALPALPSEEEEGKNVHPMSSGDVRPPAVLPAVPSEEEEGKNVRPKSSVRALAAMFEKGA
ncbi:hypothetical protein HK104_008049 [Borealophlyctis nickersoniae]|nr:hypothetical protein HK104_008049 [Borealophlyctis nickersoniae]